MAGELAREDLQELRSAIMRELRGWPENRVDALSRCVRLSADLDLLWMEYVVSGSRDAIIRIIDVLEWDDLIRRKLQVMMRSTDSWFFRRYRQTRFTKFANELHECLGVRCDVHRQNVDNPDDLDTHCMMTGTDIDAERSASARRLLTLSHAEIEQHIGVKAAAKWSLVANALQDEAILEICQNEATRRTGRCRDSLFEIIASSLFHGLI